MEAGPIYDTMQAIVFVEYGSLDALQIKDVPRPIPNDEEVLVRVHASSVNSWDWEYLNGTPFINRLMFGLFKPKPGKQRLGADIAGAVEAVGKVVTRFRPGDEVFLVTCGPIGVASQNLPACMRTNWSGSRPI